MRYASKQELGTTIVYAIGGSSLGQVLVAEGARGIVAILIGDDDAALVADLESRFPGASLQRADRALAKRLATAIALVESPSKTVALTLDARGTAFQQRVWSALREIPCGATRSYADVARDIGAPHAVRAVASACAANPVAVAIPCHRVRRGDGGLAGYRWGIERKRALLAREAAVA